MRVVPFGGKKGTNLVRKGTSKAKKEQAKSKRNRLSPKGTSKKGIETLQRRS